MISCFPIKLPLTLPPHDSDDQIREVYLFNEAESSPCSVGTGISSNHMPLGGRPLGYIEPHKAVYRQTSNCSNQLMGRVNLSFGGYLPAAVTSRGREGGQPASQSQQLLTSQ